MKIIKLLPLFFLIPVMSFSQANYTKAMVDSLEYMKADSLDCTADLFWRIVAQKQTAIPFLIEKLNDTTQTNVSFHCKKTKLNVGEVAYFALDEIADFPIYLITQRQFDVIIIDKTGEGCWSFYDYFFINANKSRYQQQVRNWYSQNKTQFREEKITLSNLKPCHHKYNITTYYRWKE